MKNRKEPAGATGPMFHNYTDLNGVDLACNAHPASDYGTTSRLLDPATPMARQVCQQVFGAAGGKANAMTFDSHSVDPMKPRNPAGWPTTTDLFPSLLKKGTR